MPHEPDNSNSPHREEILTHIKSLTSRLDVLRNAAQTQLILHNEEAIPFLMEAFKHEHGNYFVRNVPNRRGAKWIQGIVFLCVFGCAAIGLWKESRLFLSLSGLSYLAFGVFLIYTQRVGVRQPYRLTALYDLLVEMRAVPMMDHILWMIASDTIWATNQAIEYLTVHLPNLDTLQWQKMKGRERKALYALLEQRGQINTKRCYDFTFALLKALEQFGDAEAIPAVQHIAKHGSNAALRNAAKECLPYLETRRDEDSIRQTLLRASQSSGGSEELLRVPTLAPNAENAQLLRMPREQ